MYQLRVKHFRNQKNPRVQREKLHSHIICYHINQRYSLSRFKTNKMVHIQNQEQARKDKKQRHKKQTRKSAFILRSGPWNLLIPSLKGVELVSKILNSDDAFKKWETQISSQFGCCPNKLRVVWWAALPCRIVHAFFFPWRDKLLVESQSVKAWNAGRDCHNLSLSFSCIVSTGIYYWRSLTRVRNHRLFYLMAVKWDMHRAST